MPVSTGMKRLLRIRELQEEQSRSALESALRELEKLRGTLAAAGTRGAHARALVRQSVQSGSAIDRMAGLEEQKIAGRCATHVSGKVVATEQRILELRARYLSTRTEMGQAETLIANARETDAKDDAKKSQSILDEWFRCNPERHLSSR